MVFFTHIRKLLPAFFLIVFFLKTSFSDAQTTYTWIGASGGSWAVSTNWSPTRSVPAVTDILVFNSGATLTVIAVPTQTIRQLFVNTNTDVTLQSSGITTLSINGPGSTNNLIIENGSTLQMGPTNTLTITMITTASQRADISGNLYVRSGTFTTSAVATSIFTVSATGVVNNYGGTITSSAATLVFAAGSNYIHSRNGGAIPTATYNATSAVTITGITTTNPSPFTGSFGNLIWNCTGQTTATGATSGAITVNGNLQVLAGTLYDNGSQITGNASGTLTVASGAKFQVGGAVASAFPTNFIAGNISLDPNSTVQYSATAAQNISTVPSYGHLTLSGNSVKTVTGGAITVNGNLTVSAGTFADGGFAINGTAGGILSVAASATLQLGTAATATNFPLSFGTITLNSTSTVIYNSNMAQNISEVPAYGNLTLSSTGAVVKALQGNTALAGNLTINANNTLNINNFTLSFAGAYTNSGTMNASGATSTIRLNGSAASQTFATNTGAYTGNIIMNFIADNSNAAGVLLGTQSATIGYGYVTVNVSRTLNLNGQILYVKNDLLNDGTVSSTTAGSTLNMNGTTAQTISGTGTWTTGTAGRLQNLTINNTSGANPSVNLNVNLALQTSLSLTAGILGGTGALTMGIGAASTLTMTRVSGSLAISPSFNLTGVTFNATYGNGAAVSMITTGAEIPYEPSTISGTFTVNNPTNGIALGGSISLTRAGAGLTLTNGIISIGNYDISLAAATTITGGSISSFVSADATSGNTGQLKKTFNTGATAAFTFPVGDQSVSTDYSPFAITMSANSVVRTIGVCVADNTHAQMNSNGAQTDYVSRYWTFTDSQSGIGTYSYSASTFTYSTVAPTDVNGTTANYKINRWNGTDWTQLNSTVAAPNVSTSGSYTETTGTLGGNDFTLRNNAAQIYTWIATSGSADWQVAANWSPSRISPNTTDILQFSNGGTPTATNVPTQTIYRLLVSGNTNISLQSTGAVTLSINGAGLANNLQVDAGSTLQLSSTAANSINITVVTTANQRGDISGNFILNSNTSSNNTLTTTAVASTIITVNNGGAVTNNGGTVTSFAATLVFASGSAYNHARNGGAIPTATFNSGSTVNITGITTTNLTGGLTGAFGHLTWNTTGQTATGAINGVLTLAGNLTINSGTINFGANNVSVAGDVTNSGTINTSTAGATLTMNGSAPQIISGAGTWTTGTAGRILNFTVSNTSGANPGVSLNVNIAVQTSLNLTSGILGGTGTLTLGIGAASTLALTRTAGSLANIPAFNLAGVTYNVTYNTAAGITSGPELPATGVAAVSGTLTTSTASTSLNLGADVNVNNVTINAGTTVNLNNYVLGISGTYSNSGTLTANDAGSTILLNGTAASQTFTTNTGTYTGSLISNFTADNSNASGVLLGLQSATLNYGNVTINGSRVLNISGRTMRISGTFSNSGTLTANAAGSTMAFTGSSAQAFAPGTYTASLITAITIDNISGVSLSAPVNTGTLTLTSGILTTTAVNLLTVTGTTAANVSGGSATSYVSGPLVRSFPASLGSGSTYTFPVGKSAYQLFELINPTTNATGTITVEVFDASSGGTAGFALSSLNTNRYWSATPSSAFLTSATVRLTEGSLGTANRVGQSSSLNGTYVSRGGSSPSPVQASSVSPLLGFFVLGTGASVNLSGTYTVGASGTFLKLTDIAGILNTSTVTGDVIFELQSDYDGSVGETYPITFNQFTTSGGSWIATVRPASGVSLRTTSGTTSSSGLISLNGTDKITFDGRAGGTGSAIAWQVMNTQASSAYPVFLFVDGASNNTLQYLTIKSSGGSTGSTIHFSTSTVAGGNSNNTLQYCTIGPYAANSYKVIYSNGTAGANANSANSILNNNIYSWQGNNGPSFPIESAVTITATGNGSNWNISNNSFYATGIVNGNTTAAIYFGAGTASTGNTFSGNYIGGQAAQCGGDYMDYRGYWNQNVLSFAGIYVDAGTATISSNVVQNIKLWYSAGSQIFYGIYIKANTSATVNDNTIGSRTSCYSIYGGNVAMIIGIYNSSPQTPLSDVTIGNNTIANLTSNFDNPNTGFSQNGLIGIYARNGGYVTGKNTITNNEIFNLSTENNYYAASVNYPIGENGGDCGIYALSGFDPMVTGIYLCSNSSTTHSISNNTIYGLYSMVTGGTQSSAIFGIIDDTYTGTTNIDANRIYGFYAPDNYGSSGTYVMSLNGIYLSYSQLGTHNITNNIVSLGYKLDGTSVKNSAITGIWDNYYYNGTNLVVNCYYNSVYIGGSDNTAVNSFAFKRTLGGCSSGWHDAPTIKDNIFQNSRTTTGAGLHYGMYLNTVTNVASDYNLVYGNGTGYRFGYINGTGYATLAAWNTASSFDGNSLESDPLFTSPATIAPDLHVQSGSPAINAGTNVGVSADHDAETRSGSPDIGADNYNASYSSPNFVISGCVAETPLPVELLNFSGILKDEKALLFWSTATEINNDYFIVERSLEGLVFEKAGVVKGAGNSSEVKNYSFEDELHSAISRSNFEKHSQVLYYRLRQTDLDGTFNYSEIIALKNSDEKRIYIHVYPNPSSDHTIINILGHKAGNFILKLTDPLGKEIMEKKMVLKNGADHFNLDLSEVDPGIYFLTLTAQEEKNSSVFLKKIIRQ